MDLAELGKNYSQPIGPGNAYAPPPYLYRGVEDIFVTYTADPAAVASLLPPGVEAAEDPPICIAWARWTAWSSFGPYHESYIMVRANFEGETYIYQPFIFTDNEIPLVAGREIWGYAKKLAVMERSYGGSGTPFGEQAVFTVDRPKSKRIMTVSIACDELQDPAELEDLPVLSTRIIPNSTAGKAPSVAELVRLDVEAHIHESANGTPKLWRGRGSVTMDSPSQVDPWYLLAPVEILDGHFGIFDFDLYHGRVVRDYLSEDIDWV